jgi:NAD dependent epimerase/dehydratase
MAGKVLVTGADGFIGSHLVEHLVGRGDDVRAFCMYNSMGSWGWLDTVPKQTQDNLDVVLGDIRDGHCVREAMRGCDTVLHLAALIGIPYSYVAPESYVDTNVTGTLNVLMAARDLGTAKVVTTSTSEVYGSAQFVPITEDHPLVGQSPYAATKIGADQMALSFHASFDLPVAVARPFNTYGPRQSARAVIPTIITQIASGRRTIELGTLTPTRDFNFVADTARGLAAVADHPDTVGQVTNLGSAFEISVGDTARMIAEVMNADVEIVQDPARVRPEASEVDRLFASNDKARDVMGWQPEFAGLDGLRQGLTVTAEWFADPQNLARYPHLGYAI